MLLFLSILGYFLGACIVIFCSGYMGLDAENTAFFTFYWPVAIPIYFVGTVLISFFEWLYNFGKRLGKSENF